ncbi:hypothetical protein SAMN05216262_102278 [Colwellia chukchiensis]|uniref:Uncharacterized protein n=1 Tax=Colwellia chukchiensis TaxID=641665 RepID=A0A1H7JLD8_9GAMM|nr:hypothetical protein [Colwellia chukchiensis]SEK75362.1 hypothetical protein SAMN05216262_102278 [Colwellia chukchiensis]
MNNLEKTSINVANYLEPYVKNVEKHYHWSFDEAKASQFTGYDFSGEKNYYQKTKVLKTVLQEKLNSQTSFESEVALARYFIKDWGGVKIQETPLRELVSYYANFKGKDSNAAAQLNIKGVSSWSKYLSLICDWAPIYDSRVAYSLNTINFMSGHTDIFFQMVEGRSSRLKLLDINTLFLQEKLKNGSLVISDFEHKQFASKLVKKYTTSNNETYAIYVKLIADIANNLSATTTDIEMLLFALAPKDISFDLLMKYQTKP